MYESGGALELDPELIKAFETLKVSSRPISAKELAAFDEKAPLKERDEKDHPSYAKIPKFFDPPPRPEDKIRQLLRREAHSLFLEQQAEKLLDNEELNELWTILERHVTETTDAKQQLIAVEDYLRALEKISVKCRKFMTPRLFAILLMNSNFPGKVEIITIYNYAMRKVLLTQGTIGLSFYDENGKGYLREIDLENYICDMIPTLAQIRDSMPVSFENFYVCTVVKKIFFFLDSMHTGRIRVKDIVSQGILSEILDLRGEEKKEELEEDADGDQVEPELNWFSMAAVMKVYENYLSLDKDHNGLLGKEELADYGSGSFTSIFLDRVFEVVRTFDGEMDYKSYLDFAFALEHRDKHPALHYLFRLLDIDHQGYLTAQTLNCFFKGIQENLIASKAEEVSFQDFKDEIFDMIKPKDPLKITLKDLITSGQGDTVVSILIEYHKFCAYENRDENAQNI